MTIQGQGEHKSKNEFNIKAFLIAVIAAAVVVCVLLLITVARKGRKLEPGPGTTHPTSRLAAPSAGAALRA